MKKALSLVLALCMMLSIAVVSASADEITDLRTYETTAREMETFNPHYSQAAVDLNVLSNCVDGLLTNDPKGALVPSAAKSFVSEDAGQTWTFVLNDGMTWVDKDGNVKADVVAEDWLWGLEWVLNFAKNDSANTSMPIEMIVGAGEYYEYTKALAEKDGAAAAQALNLDKFKEMVGVSATDDKTLVFKCVDKLSYFPTLTTYNCLYPVSGKLLAELGVEGYRGVTWETLWYSGPYTITSYIHQNEKVLTANPNWYGKATNKTFNTVTIKMVDSLDVAYSLFQTGELDNVNLSQSTLSTIAGSESNEFHKNLAESLPTKYSFQIHFSYDKKTEAGEADTNWNTAIANEAFRLSWYYGLELTSYLARTNAINPQSCQNYAYTANKVAVTSAGEDYTSLVLKELGLEYSKESFTRYDAEKATAYKKQAIEELTALGVTFPVVADYYVMGSSQTAMDTAQTLAQIFTDFLGDDYVKLNVKTYVTSLSQEVRNPQLGSFYINGWGADFGDPINFLGQETYGEDNAYYSQAYSKINNATDEKLISAYKEFTKMVTDAKAITDDLDARYAAFAKAEAFFISHAFTIPSSYEVLWQLTSINDYSKINSAYGNQNTRYLNWETNSNIYTTEEYEAFAAK